MRDFWGRIRGAAETVARWTRGAVVSPVRSNFAELLTAAAFLGGWAFFTAGTAGIAEVFGAADIVWLLSIGLLLFSLGGWRLLLTMVIEGLYALAKMDPERRKRRA